MGAQLVKEAASKTNDAVGDGTTTSTLLAQSLINKGMKYVSAGVNPMIMKIGMDKAVKDVIKQVKELATPIKESDWKKVATISAQNEEIGEKISEALKKVGKDGVVEVEDGSSMEISIDHKEGMELEKGYASSYFVTNPDNMEAISEKPYILVTDQKINNVKDILPILQLVIEETRQLVIIGEIADVPLKDMIVNTVNGKIRALVVNPPGFGDARKELLEDIASLVGATVVTEEKGMSLSEITADVLGQADNVRSTKSNTTIVGGKGNKEERISQIDSLIKKAEPGFELDKLNKRKAKLSGGVAVIKVTLPITT